LGQYLNPRNIDVTGRYGKLHKEKFNTFFYSPNTVRKMESRKIRWLCNAAQMGYEEVHTF
jgi:hypothetical protein